MTAARFRNRPSLLWKCLARLLHPVYLRLSKSSP
jgi:hypothetical protein